MAMENSTSSETKYFYLFSCGFAMICEKFENRVTAQNVLATIIKFAQQHCDVLAKPQEVSAL